MPSANASVPIPKQAKTKPMCPRCGQYRSREIEPGRFSCNTCGSVFEPLEQNFIDDRPEQNAMKKERSR